MLTYQVFTLIVFPFNLFFHVFYHFLKVVYQVKLDSGLDNNLITKNIGKIAGNVPLAIVGVCARAYAHAHQQQFCY